MSSVVGRPLPEFLADVELELRTVASMLGHERGGRSTPAFPEGRHSSPCRKCDLIRLADEAADRAALLVTEGVAR